MIRRGGFSALRRHVHAPRGMCSVPTRQDSLHRLQDTPEFDLLVIGGGATGAGAALDGALRGLKVACVEREDF